MKRVAGLLLSMLLLITLASCGAREEKTAATTENSAVAAEQAMQLYDEFLAGERSAKQRTPFEGDIYCDDIFLGDEWDRYAFFDMNGDSIPELHIRSASNYYIIALKDVNLIVWACPGYGVLLNNAAILREKDGSGLSKRYSYIEYDLHGNEQLRIEFSKWNARILSNNDLAFDETSDYVFDGEHVSKEEWDTLTEKYFSIEPADIEWINVDEQ